MNRQQKEQVVDVLRDNFSNSAASLLVGYRGLTVLQLQTLRKELRQHGGTVKVSKARLMHRAAQGIKGVEEMQPYFKDQIAVVFSKQDVPAVAKSLYEFSKENAALSIIAGCFEQQLLDAQAVVEIASLPPKKVLQAKLLGVLQGPVRSLAVCLSMKTKQLLFVLKQLAEKK